MRAVGAALAVAVATAGCLSVKPLVLDRQMQLEKQILGRLDRLEAEVILASSVRAGAGAAPRTREVSPLRRELLAVQRDRAFRADDLDAIKDQGLAGEGRDGKIVLLAPSQKVPGGKRVQQLIADENRDRERLVRALIAVDAELSKRDAPLLWRILARLSRSTARPGHKVQLADGRWTTVAAQKAKGASRR
ncbi:MAG: hypothetical protein CSA65_07965 [Proteobacteria bacterium]|nr:MAG: hypothetical protein CSA65_07965 [Pseudomonadota bacterium]